MSEKSEAFKNGVMIAKRARDEDGIDPKETLKSYEKWQNTPDDTGEKPLGAQTTETRDGIHSVAFPPKKGKSKVLDATVDKEIQDLKSQEAAIQKEKDLSTKPDIVRKGLEDGVIRETLPPLKKFEEKGKVVTPKVAPKTNNLPMKKKSEETTIEHKKTSTNDAKEVNPFNPVKPKSAGDLPQKSIPLKTREFRENPNAPKIIDNSKGNEDNILGVSDDVEDGVVNMIAGGLTGFVMSGGNPLGALLGVTGGFANTKEASEKEEKESIEANRKFKEKMFENEEKHAQDILDKENKEISSVNKDNRIYEAWKQKNKTQFSQEEYLADKEAKQQWILDRRDAKDKMTLEEYKTSKKKEEENGGVVEGGFNREAYDNATESKRVVDSITQDDVSKVDGWSWFDEAVQNEDYGNATAKFNQLFSQSFMDGIEALRGMGSLSNIEGGRVISARNALVNADGTGIKKGLSKEFINEQLKIIRDNMVKAQKRELFKKKFGKDPSPSQLSQM